MLNTPVYNIGLLGCGTVGSGVIKILRKSQKDKSNICISKILVRNNKRASEISAELGLNIEIFTTNPDDVVKNPDIDIVIEVMGGVVETKSLLLSALEHGKDIVTANKDLLALEGEELFETAKKFKRTILFEAAVAGGIPIIVTLKQSLQANHIQEIQGIINGTTNYILDSMKKEGRSFDEALKRAQELGFAESDPTNDIDGHDAAYKIAILASIISGKRVNVKQVYREGIRNISIEDIRSAAKRGYEIKLLGIINNRESKLDVRVHPVFVPFSNPLASVAQEKNAILIKGDALEELCLIGRGAGSLPTASSVVGDLLMLLALRDSGASTYPQYICQHHEYAELKDFGEIQNSFYIRVSMHDKVGVLKDLGEITSRNGANVKFIDQYDVSGTEAHADFIVDPISEAAKDRMITEIEALDSIKAVESVIRVA